MQHSDGGQGPHASQQSDTALTPEQETLLLAEVTGLDLQCAAAIVGFGVRTRRLRTCGLGMGATTDMLLAAAFLVARGWTPAQACRIAVVHALNPTGRPAPTVPLAVGAPHEVAGVLEATLASCF